MAAVIELICVEIFYSFFKTLILNQIYHFSSNPKSKLVFNW